MQFLITTKRSIRHDFIFGHFTYLTLSVPNLSSAFFLTKYRLEIRLYVNLKDGMSNSVDPDETAHCHLDLCCLQKPVVIAYGSEKVNRWSVLCSHALTLDENHPSNCLKLKYLREHLGNKAGTHIKYHVWIKKTRYVIILTHIKYHMWIGARSVVVIY